MEYNTIPHFWLLLSFSAVSNIPFFSLPVTFRLIHPLSPRGKLVHWGREGLEATNRLVTIAEAAAAAASNKDKSPPQIVVRDQLYRLAVTEQHVEQLQATANNLREYCTWWTTDQLIQAGVISTTGTEAADANTNTNTTVLGGLCLHNGCRVIHVPSYLQGLWAACRERGAVWELVGNDDVSVDDWKTRLQDYDAVVLAAGSGLFSAQTQTPKNGSNNSSSSLLSREDFPLQLVRGQSVELRVPDRVKANDHGHPSQALLCGKYVSPLPGDPNLYLVGATHEFREEALSPTAVKAELQKLTVDFSSHLWKNASVERWTMGYRVQSERGKYGRMPMIGRLPTTSDAATSDEQLPETPMPIHANTWIFTGLSSRGLLYHALYGDILTDALLGGSEEPMLSRCSDLTWWRK
jgi:glycine/D-amino acid oxidase-like deaminating enzyme